MMDEGVDLLARPYFHISFQRRYPASESYSTIQLLLIPLLPSAWNLQEPLDMKQSFVRGEHNIHLPPTSPYKFWFGYPVEFPSQVNNGPVGPTGIHSSAEDMGQYIRAYAKGRLQVTFPSVF